MQVSVISRRPAKSVPEGARSRRGRGERGSTLVELLIATSIMGIAIVALLVGTTTLETLSASNRQSTTTGIVARDYAEALALATSQPGVFCAASYTVTYTPPTGYSVGTAFGACPGAAAAQYQTVTITATAPNGSTETLRTVVRKL